MDFMALLHQAMKQTDLLTLAWLSCNMNQKFDVSGNIGYRNYDNYKDGDGTEIPSAFKSTDYGIKVGYNLRKDHRIQARMETSLRSGYVARRFANGYRL